MLYILEFLKKEIKEYIRNWKSWIALLVLPIIVLPVSLVTPVIIGESTSDTNEDNVYNLYIDQSQNDSVTSMLTESDTFKRTDDIKKSDIKIIEVNNDDHTLNIKYDSNNTNSVEAFETLNLMVNEYSKQNMVKKLESLDAEVPPDIKIDAHDELDTEEIGNNILSYFLPIGISIMVVMGGILQGSSALAGEKDNETMESILLLPISHGKIILIKFLIVLLTNIKNVLAAFMGVYLSIFLIKKFTDLTLIISINHYLYLLLIAILASLFFSSLHLLLSVISKNVKEAQSYSTIFSTIFLIVMIGGTFLVDGEWWVYLTPAINFYTMVQDSFPLQIDIVHLLTMLTSSIVITIVFLLIATFLFKKERYALKN